ncbi:hypothetical protein AA983_11820 [Dermacoccus sp. PE3]|nr:hypothetical protein AA983_11820 [Dermacoccus sp. PE3]
MGQKVIVEVDADRTHVTLRAPFYRRSIPLRDIAFAEAHPDDGRNHGALNWFVVGRENSSGGVRLNTGDIVTSDVRRYGVVVDTMERARQIVDALRVTGH